MNLTLDVSLPDEHLKTSDDAWFECRKNFDLTSEEVREKNMRDLITEYRSEKMVGLPIIYPRILIVKDT